MIDTLIIGKDSNLSSEIGAQIDDSVLISSREIMKNIEILKKYKNKKINIIFNNFQPAVQLNNTESTQQYILNSIVSTSMVLDYFKNSPVQKMIYTSSSSVYGNNILCKEEDELKPMNLHASLKVANEKLIAKYCCDNNIDYTIARIFNMYGGNDRFSVISKIIHAYKYNEVLTVVNNGNAIRDFIHINDVVYVYKKLLTLKHINILNIGTGSGNSIKGILDFLSYNGINIKVKNIVRDELKISTADVNILMTVLGVYDFQNLQTYMKKELIG